MSAEIEKLLDAVSFYMFEKSSDFSPCLGSSNMERKTRKDKAIKNVEEALNEWIKHYLDRNCPHDAP